MDEVVQMIEQFSLKNLILLNRKSMIIDNVCIVGCTLWSKIEQLPFFVRIPELTTSKYNSLFYSDLNYIKGMIQYCKTHNLKLLVVTHYCPTMKFIKRLNKYDCLYGSNLDYLLRGELVHTWVFGHNHENVDCFSRDGTRLVTNQRGKPKDAFAIDGFSKEKIIRL